MSDLAEFLLARIAEDEVELAVVTERDPILPGDRMTWLGSLDDLDIVVSAARAKAECEAKRRIVEWHTETEDCCDERFGPLTFDVESEWSAGVDSLGNLTMRQSIGVQPFIGCVTLMMLAWPYADHRDYREEWRL